MAAWLFIPLPAAPTPDGNTIATRFTPPAGFERTACAPGSFGTWLRALRLKPGRPEVRLYNGRLKGNQDAHCAVLDMDVGSRDLQQCADAVIRLRAEYLYAGGCGDVIMFRFTNGAPAAWRDWRRGLRPSITRRGTTWRKTAAADSGYASFRRYLNVVFTYAGTASLEKELLPVADRARPEPGDVYIHGGFPGHAVIVADAAENGRGERVFLLAQSYMPAQEIHVLHSYDASDPWYRASGEGLLQTPEWTFDRGELRRFARSICE